MSSLCAFTTSIPIVRNTATHLNSGKSSIFPLLQPIVRTTPKRIALRNVAPNGGATMSQLKASAGTTQEEETQTFDSLFEDKANATVLTEDGKEVSLLRFVEEQNANGNAVLFGWLRHYGCTLCIKQASNWRDWLPDLNSSGRLTVALVGNGPVSQVLGFKDEVNWPAYLFTDPERRSYAALSFRNDLPALLNRTALFKVIRSFFEGHKQTLSRLPTDPLQQGGVVLVDHTGRVSFLHSDEFAGDHVDKDTLFEAVNSAVST